MKELKAVVGTNSRQQSRECHRGLRLVAGLCLSVLIEMSAFGQALEAEWATSLGAAQGVWFWVNAMAEGATRDLLLTGYCRGGLPFAAIYSPDGSLVSVVEASNTSDWGQGLAVAGNAEDHLWVAGMFSGRLAFAPATSLLASNEGTSLFVARFDANGRCLWAAQAKGATPTAMTTDDAGNCYLIGSMLGRAQFGSITLINRAGEHEGLFMDVFVAKLDAAGNWAWVRRAGSPWRDHGYAVAWNPAGKVIVTGDADYGCEWQTSDGATTTLGDGTIVGCWNSDGDLLWVRHFLQGTSGAWTPAASGRALARSRANTFYCAGILWEPVALGSKTLTNAGDFDLWVAEFNLDGEVLWAGQAGGVWSNANVKGVAVNALGECAAVADFSGSATLADRSYTCEYGAPDIGLIRWDARHGGVSVLQEGAEKGEYGTAVSLSDDGSLVATGNFYGRTKLGRFELLADNLSSDVFLVKAECRPSLAIGLRDGHAVLTVSARVGTTNEVQFTSDLARDTWTTLARLVFTEPTQQVIDGDLAVDDRRFYRVVWSHPGR